MFISIRGLFTAVAHLPKIDDYQRHAESVYDGQC